MGTEITNYDKAFADAAQQYASDEPLSGGSFISTRGGVLSFNDEELPGSQMAVVVLDSVRENTYYGAKFDPEVPAAPKCYAFGRGNEEMGPHESMQADPSYFQPQHDSCTGCKWAEWGSADTGKGKACQNRRRLALIPAGYYVKKKGSRDFDLEMFDDPKHFQTADMVFMKIPPTSVEEWSKYVSQLNASVQRPPYGVITRVYLEPHVKHQYHVKFEMLEKLSNDLAPIVIARNLAAAGEIIQPYSPPKLDDVPAARGGIRGLRR